MRKTSFALALLTAAVLTACGGNGPSAGNQTPKTKFSNQITFGDSLSASHLCRRRRRCTRWWPVHHQRQQHLGQS